VGYCTDCGGTGAAENGYECSGCWGAGWTPPLALDEFDTSPERTAQRAALLNALCDGTLKVARRRKASGAAMQRDTSYQGMSNAELNKLDGFNTPMKRRKAKS